MKKIFIPSVLSLALLLSSCYGFGATGTGAAVGGVLGSIIGHSSHNWYGSQVGGLIGTIAGAAVGSAIDRSEAESQYEKISKQNQEMRQRQQAAAQQRQEYAYSPVELDEFRFIDEDNSQTIEVGESCKIVFDVVNNSDQTMRNVEPILEVVDGTKGVLIGEGKVIDELQAHERVTYNLPIRVTRYKAGGISFKAYAKDGNGAYTAPIDFTLEVKK